MPEWPVTVAFTDEEAAAIRRLAEEEFDGDRDAAVQALLDGWLDERGGGESPFKR